MASKKQLKIEVDLLRRHMGLEAQRANGPIIMVTEEAVEAAAEVMYNSQFDDIKWRDLRDGASKEKWRKFAMAGLMEGIPHLRVHS